MTNDQMKANRYLTWANARRKLAWVKARLAEGRTVAVTTYTKQTRYKPQHADMFVARKNGLFVQRGKSFVCLNFSHISAF